MQNTNININCIACIYPTAAIINYKDLIYAYKQFNLNKKIIYIFCDKIFISHAESFILRKKIINLFKNQCRKRSQDLEMYIMMLDNIIFLQKEMIRKNINIFSKIHIGIFKGN